MKNIFLPLLALLILTFSCSSDDDTFYEEVVIPKGAYENGIIVSSEGGPSSISFISEDLSSSENNIYFNVNNEDLGVYLQSVGFHNDLAYIITDTNHTITIVNRNTFEKVGTITTGLQTPRYISFLNGKAYVSNWGDSADGTDDFVAVLDLSSNTVENTIPVGEGPEQVLANGDKVFVSHKGGWGTNNIVSIIDANSNIVDTITVNDNPDEMIINNAGELVVLSSGKEAWTGTETLGAIAKIDVNNNTVISNFEFEMGVHPNLMDYANGTLYFQTSENKIYTMADTDTALPTTSTIDLTTAYTYGMAVKGDRLFVADASFSSQSEVVVYDLPSATETHSFSAGIGASKIYFN
ncbi:YncE family protein [Oceanihabitans sediminis]|uniref:Cell surface protein n=1 Tax=Oceanihabitans sediminis TaxID=1812012 RepID=A0A368P5F2_9FLAO|nr:DUF5074 domain-containing protein [Oceanihabitans sediminis]MDX1279127.1 cell surface protein [Oceanihabitans sediminis]MDX1774550.1 cell surface protein [Oceanihabitans sediminis]RBP29053.1 YVTN family beta-propeller protein [Oceanihabitans sediminis]RCU57019.1 cell surface protein [Oceanihabitans sediminis]